MANESTEISGIVKKCKILLLDIEGTTTSISFVKDKLFPYVEENVKQFLETKWENEDVKEAVTALRKLALEDQEKSVEGVVAIPGEDASKEEQIEGLVKNVKWQMSADRKAGPLKQLQGLIWKQGYDSGDIKGHVYDDVLPALEQWRATEGHKVYIYSSGSVGAQQLLFGQSLAGDMLPLIDGHFDTAVGAKQETSSYAAIVENIGCKAEEILFLTDIVQEAEAARAAGLQAALAARAGNAALAAGAAARFPVLHSLAQLAVSNKRKTDPQDEQPAKIARTDPDVDVKSVEKVSNAPETVVAEQQEKAEKMEVEDTSLVEQTTTENGEQKMEDSPVEKAVVEEITDSNDIADIPVINVEPVVIEESDKTDEKETEKMETEVTETISPKSVPDKKETTSEEKATTIVTEIEEITDKQPVPDAVEVIDIVPVVEEPNAAEDIEELQNVGESLEKECEEILSKVQDVTNLDNIPLKPLLNTISEENMETDNTDSNDIVDRILDTELELGMKQCDDIDLNNVQELKGTKTVDMASDKTEQVEAVAENNRSEVKEVVQETKAEKSADNMEESSLTKTLTESKPVEVEMKETPEECKEKPEESKVTPEECKVTPEESNVTCEESKVTPEESKVKPEEKKVTPEESKVTPEETTVAMEVRKETPEESKEAVVKTNGSVETQTTTDKSEVGEPEVKEIDKPAETNAEDVKVNGNMTNGDSEMVNLNGDAKNEELNSRLQVENSKEVNGSNGDAKVVEEKGQGDAKEMDVAEIKVKSVSVDEPHTDPIEQPSEA